MKNTKPEKKSIMNIGTSLMIVILIGLSFIVIAALAISSAKNNYNLSERYDNHTREYYEASNMAYEKIARSNWRDASFEIPVGKQQVLEVSVKNHQIESWKVVYTDDWEMDDSLPVHNGVGDLDAPLPIHQ